MATGMGGETDPDVVRIEQSVCTRNRIEPEQRRRYVFGECTVFLFSLILLVAVCVILRERIELLCVPTPLFVAVHFD